MQLDRLEISLFSVVNLTQYGYGMRDRDHRRSKCGLANASALATFDCRPINFERGGMSQCQPSSSGLFAAVLSDHRSAVRKVCFLHALGGHGEVHITLAMLSYSSCFVFIGSVASGSQCLTGFHKHDANVIRWSADQEKNIMSVTLRTLHANFSGKSFPLPKLRCLVHGRPG